MTVRNLIHSAPVRPEASLPSTNRRQLAGLVLGPLFLAGILLAPLSLPPNQHALVGVLALTMTFWVTDALPIPVTSILALALCVVLDVPASGGSERPAEIVFSQFSSPTLFLLIGSLIVAQSLIKCNLGRRIALRMLAIPGVTNSTYTIVIALGLLTILTGSVVDNGAVVAMLLPVALGLHEELQHSLKHAGCESDAPRLRTAMLLMIAYGATVGNLLTPVGDSSNLVGRTFIEDELGLRVSFADWVLMATPIVAVMFVVLCVAVLGINRPEVRRLDGIRQLVRRERRELGPLTRPEINTMIAFSVAVTLWLAPTVAGMLAGRGSPLHTTMIERLDPAVAAMLASVLLFILPTDWKRWQFTLNWTDAARINWGAILLVGTGLTLGAMMESTGLAHSLGTSLASSLGSNAWLVYLAIAVVGVLLSELTSNVASIGVIISIIPVVTAAGGGDPVTAVLVATFATKYGFMLPISTSANAIAYGSGAVTLGSMLRTGIFVDLSGILIVVFGVPIMARAVGIA